MRQTRTLKALTSEKIYETGIFEDFFKFNAKENPDEKITSLVFGVLIEEYLIHLFKKAGVIRYRNFIKYLMTDNTVSAANFFRFIRLLKHLPENKDEIKFRRFMELFFKSEDKNKIITFEEMKLFCLIGTVEAFDFAFEILKSSLNLQLVLRYLSFCTDCSCELFIHACEKMHCFRTLRVNLSKLSDVGFKNFVKSLKYMVLDEQVELKELELLCLLGTFEAFDAAFAKFNLDKKTIEEKKWILRCLLSGANCSCELIVHACKQMNCFETLGTKLSELNPEKFKLFINSWKRISPRERSELGELELLCLLGTFDETFVESLTFNSIEVFEKRKQVLKYLLLSNNRSLIETTAKRMGLVYGGIFSDSLIDLSYADFSGWNLDDLDLHGINFSFAKFIGTKLARAQFFGTNVWRANFTRAELQKVDLRRTGNVKTAIWNNAKLIEANLSGMDLERIDGGFSTENNLIDYNNGIPSFCGTDFTGANLEGTSLFGSDCENAKFLKDTNLNKANLSDANLTGAHFDGAHLQKAVLGNAKLNNASFVGADLYSTDFCHVKNRRLNNRYDMNNVFIAVLLSPIVIPLFLLAAILEIAMDTCETIAQEISPPQEPPEGQSDVTINFKNAQAEGANLEGLSIKNSNLRHADFKNAKMSSTVFKDCDIKKADFSGVSFGFLRTSRPWVSVSKGDKKTRVGHLSFFTKDDRKTLISLFKEYLKGQSFVGMQYRHYEIEVRSCVEFAEKNTAIIAEELILLLAKELVDNEIKTLQSVRVKGTLFKIVNEFCLMKLKKPLDHYLIMSKNSILADTKTQGSLQTVSIATAA